MTMSGVKSAFKQTPAANGRVIDGLSPEMPSAEAIRLSLGGRLQAILELIPDAAAHAGDDARVVHRLRVTTRRAAAAIRAFKDTAPKKHRKAVLQILKELRSAASDARAADVDLTALGTTLEAASTGRASAISFVMGAIASEREVAARSLIECCSGDVAKRLQKASVRLLKSATKRSSENEAFLACSEQAVARPVEKAVRAAHADLTTIDHVHQLRIECKRLRYTLESIGPCADALGLRPLYDLLVESQDQFGAVNDAHELAARIAALHDRYSQPPFELPSTLAEELCVFRDELADRSRSTHAAFLDWWESAPLHQFLTNADSAARPLNGHTQVSAISASHNGAEEATT